MKKRLEELLQDAVAILKSNGDLPTELEPECLIERARDAQHGDFATNLAMTLAKPARSNPRALAEKIIAALPADPAVIRVKIAGPGFINFFIDPQAQFGIIRDIHEAAHEFGKSHSGAGQRVQVEFVSANPTCWRRSVVRCIASIT
jgi:arginyl-tRNA synthetase